MENSAKTINVLLVEDSADDATLLARELTLGQYEVKFERVDTRRTMSAALDRQPWDAILADWSMPTFSGPAALQLLKEKDIDIPFILVSGQIGEEAAVAAMKAGAHDFVPKNKLARLVPALEREIREAEVRRSRREAEQAVKLSEGRFRALFEDAPAAYHETDSAGIVRRVNRTECTLLGLCPEEILGRPVWDLWPTELREVDRLRVQGMIAGNEDPSPWELEYVHPSGSRLHLEAYQSLIHDPNGNVTGLCCALLDRTDNKRAEIDLQGHLQRLSALVLIENATKESLDLNAILRTVVDQVITHLKVDASDILLFQRKDQALEFAVGQGFRSRRRISYRTPLGEGNAGRTAAAGDATHVENVETADAALREPLPEGEAFLAYHAVPLAARGHLQGVLELFHRSPFQLSKDWSDFLDAVALATAIAIDNARLVEDLQDGFNTLSKSQEANLRGWVCALNLRFKGRQEHVVRVSEMTVRIAGLMGVFGGELEQIRRGVLLYDIGRLVIPDDLLNRAGRLTPEERAIYERYPQHASEILYPIEHLRPALDIPHCHRENWDGSGYPRGLRGNEIPLAARIFAVVNAWDYLACARPEGAGWPESRVYSYLWDQAGKSFDPSVVRVLFNYLMSAEENELLSRQVPEARTLSTLSPSQASW